LTIELKRNILKVGNIKNQKLLSSRSLLSPVNKLSHLIASKVANNNISLAMGKGKRKASNCFGETGVGAMPKGKNDYLALTPYRSPVCSALIDFY